MGSLRCVEHGTIADQTSRLTMGDSIGHRHRAGGRPCGGRRASEEAARTGAWQVGQWAAFRFFQVETHGARQHLEFTVYRSAHPALSLTASGGRVDIRPGVCAGPV
jgi:hypothetical protein